MRGEIYPPSEVPPMSPGAPAAAGTEPAPGAAQFPEDVPVYDQPSPTPEPSNEGGEQGNVSVSEYMTVDMFVQDEDLANVLQMLSLQSRKNIVAARDVDAKVSANLYGVTFYEALDSILHVNGYGYIEKGNFIYVYTMEEMEKIRADDRRMVSKVIRLNYLNANDAAEFVAPLLSEKGKIKTNGDVGSFTIPADSPTGDEQFALSATLVIYDYPEQIGEIEALLTQLDSKPAQVLVEATILQTSLTENNAFGVDFAFLNGVNFTDFFDIGGALGAPNVLNAGDEFLPADNRAGAVALTPGNTSGPATIKLGLLHDDIALFIRALDEVSDVNIVSNPKILALNRQSAKVEIGRKIGYLKSTTNNGVTEQDVEFLPTGTSLAFRPFVSNDGLIRMELKPKVSEGIINQFTDNDGRTVTVPDEVSQEITTNVVVPDGSTVVLGGLFRESTRLKRSQVPVLGDIPLIGAAFRGQDDTTDRTEIIFMIKPTIVNDQVLLTQGENAVQYAENVRAGSRQGLLPWSRDRQTAQLNVRAERLAAEGKTAEAQNLLGRSLELNPSQPEVYRMQQQLGATTPTWPQRSLMERIINEKAAERAASLPQDPAAAPAPAFIQPAADATSAGEPASSQHPSSADGKPRQWKGHPASRQVTQAPVNE
jgi:type IV pilus secretin PilQ/predicted competence protein